MKIDIIKGEPEAGGWGCEFGPIAIFILCLAITACFLMSLAGPFLTGGS